MKEKSFKEELEMQDEQKECSDAVSKTVFESLIDDIYNKLDNNINELVDLSVKKGRKVLIERIKNYVREVMGDKIKEMKQQGIADCSSLEKHIQDMPDNLDPILKDLEKSFLRDSKLLITLIIIVAIVVLAAFIFFHEIKIFIKETGAIKFLALVGAGIIAYIVRELSKKSVKSKLTDIIENKLRKELFKIINPLIPHHPEKPEGKLSRIKRKVIEKLPFIKSLTDKQKPRD